MRGDVCQPIKGHLREPFLLALSSIGISGPFFGITAVWGPSSSSTYCLDPRRRKRKRWSARYNIKFSWFFPCIVFLFSVRRHSTSYGVPVWPCWSGQNSHLSIFQSQPSEQGRNQDFSIVIDKTALFTLIVTGFGCDRLMTLTLTLRHAKFLRHFFGKCVISMIAM